MYENLGKLVLRLNLGSLLFLRGLHFLLNGLDPLKAMLASYNIPEAAAFGVFLGELVAPAMIILGVYSRVGGALIVLNMLVAVALVHGGSEVLLMPDNGGFCMELEAFYLIGGLGVMLLGAGRFALGPRSWN